MLCTLSIRNFILIDELDLDFEEGFCAITGETGAGKSIILDAILFCLGGKFHSLSKYDGDKNISVSACFGNIREEIVSYIEDLGIEELDILTIKRVETANKSRKFFINDQLVTAKTIEYIAPYLFEIHGQNTHISLLSSSTHIDILDDFGGLQDQRSKISTIYKQLQEIMRNIAQFVSSKESINSEIDYLSFVVDELSKMNIRPDEEEELSLLRNELKARDKETSFISEIIADLEQSNIADSISRIVRLLVRKNLESAHWQKILVEFEAAYDHIENAHGALKTYLNSFDANDLETIEDRLFAMKDMARKYKVPAGGLMQFLNESKLKLSDLTALVRNEHDLEEGLQNITSHYQKLATVLSDARGSAALKLMKIVQNSLGQLNMPKAIFKIEVTENKAELTNKGSNNVRFIASTNPGMPLGPIDKVASGGELARFMLALKTALFDKYKKPLMIFDEIDVGIGGSAANAVGEHLRKLSTSAQVLVITHQAQIAAKANQHVLVTKNQLKENTKITVKSLDQNERVYEIARMISGNHITDSTIVTAREMMDANISCIALKEILP
jgi:DNA repair protein RecN (Recombination protein N)